LGFKILLDLGKNSRLQPELVSKFAFEWINLRRCVWAKRRVRRAMRAMRKLRALQCFVAWWRAVQLESRLTH
jgi:hypothetical protein